MAQIRVTGLNRLVRDFKRAGGQAEDLKDILAPIGETVKKKARDIVPKRSGDLRGSIRVSRQQRRVIIRAGWRNIDYAPFVAYGSVHNPSPKPFLNDALKQANVSDEVATAIAQILAKAGL